MNRHIGFSVEPIKVVNLLVFGIYKNEI